MNYQINLTIIILLQNIFYIVKTMSLQKSVFKDHIKSHGVDTTMDAGISNKSTAAG